LMTIVYIIVGLGGLVILIMTIGAPFGYIAKRKKKKTVQDYRNHVDYKLDNIDEAVIREYMEGGEHRVQKLQTLLGDEQYLNDVCDVYAAQKVKLEENSEEMEPHIIEVAEDKPTIIVKTLRRVMREKLIEKSGEKWVVPDRAQEAINSFTGYLKLRAR